MCENTRMNWRRKLESLRRGKKWTQEELAERVGVSVSTINSWIKGTRTPEMGNLQKIASVFGMSLDEFLKENLERNSNVEALSSSTKLMYVPLISWTRATFWPKYVGSGESLAADPFRAEGGEERIITNISVGKEAFALQVKGDLMEPEFPEGCTIIVDPGRKAIHGSYVVVHIEDDKEATFKQLILDGFRKYLKPANDRYPILEVTGKKVRICGVVVQQIKIYPDYPSPGLYK